jgi:hypothetical protein
MVQSQPRQIVCKTLSQKKKKRKKTKQKKTSHKKGLVELAQGKCPEFKHQYWKKKIIK